MSSNEQWHLSKTVPVSFILAILAQTVALIWFIATLSNDVDTNKNSIHSLQDEVKSIRSVVFSQEVTLGRIDENIKSIRMLIEKSYR